MNHFLQFFFIFLQKNMVDYLAEYKAYYTARAKRFENDADFPFTEKAENDLRDAMLSCNELGEFKVKLGNLNDLCAVALVKDTNALRYRHYVALEEKIRALGPERIQEKADQYDNVMDLITMINEEENRNSLEIAADSTEPFEGNWFMLERLEVYENAIVPLRWKPKMAESAAEIRESLRENHATTTEDMQRWKTGWKLDLNLVWETRHRRRFPYPDEEIRLRIEQYKKTVPHT